jgi:hypothetical protein
MVWLIIHLLIPSSLSPICNWNGFRHSYQTRPIDKHSRCQAVRPLGRPSISIEPGDKSFAVENDIHCDFSRESVLSCVFSFLWKSYIIVVLVRLSSRCVLRRAHFMCSSNELKRIEAPAFYGEVNCNSVTSCSSWPTKSFRQGNAINLLRIQLCITAN